MCLLPALPRDVGSGEFLKNVPIVEIRVFCVLMEQEVWVWKEKSCKKGWCTGVRV